MLDSTKASATVDQSIRLPDYFGCSNCKGNDALVFCRELRAEGLCAKEMLREALKMGAVQVILHLPAGGQR